jgi:hypothetical protein
VLFIGGMWRLVVIALCLVVATHHGAPGLAHATQPVQVPTSTQCAGEHCGGGPHNGAHDDAGMLAACLAILALVAGAALGRRVGRLVRVAMPTLCIAPWCVKSVRPGPPAHGPPRPIRLCVLLR